MFDQASIQAVSDSLIPFPLDPILKGTETRRRGARNTHPVTFGDSYAVSLLYYQDLAWPREA